MIWDDIGFLISKNKYNENSFIAEIYTKNHGKVSGIIFGGTSKRIRNYLQIGNQIFINYNSKSENRLGYFKVEIEKALSPLYFDDQKKLSCITSAMNLIKILTAESQRNKNIYILIEKFYKLLETKNWIKNYIYWELELFKNLGYDLDFNDLVTKEYKSNIIIYTTKSISNKKIVPNFLIDRDENEEDLRNLLSGLKIVGDYLDKTILSQKNLNFPQSRAHFVNTLK